MRSLPPPGRRLLAVVVLSAGIGLLGGGLGAWAMYSHFGPVERVVTQTRVGGGGVAIADVAAAVQRSIVIVATQPATAESLAGSAAGSAPGLAEGVVVSADGLVLTTARAVSGATRLRIGSADGRSFDATIAGSDVPDGLVLLRAFGAAGLSPLRLASQPSRIGDVAILVSRPALGPLTTRSGAVAAVGLTAAAGTGFVSDLISVDATQAPDGEGAPLVDGSGALIGVVTVPPQSVGVVAASGRDAAALIAASPGQASRPTGFGVTAVVLSVATAAAAGLPAGALVRAVSPLGPSAGLLHVGDIITAVNGGTVRTPAFVPAAFGLRPGDVVQLTVVDAAGTTRTVTLTLASG